MRHLNEQQTFAALRRGARIEQMLTDRLSDQTLKWLSASPTDRGIALRVHHVRDEGSADFLDVYEFRPVDDEEDIGEGRLVGEYPDAERVLSAAVGLGGRRDRWLNAGVIQDEYNNLRAAKR